MQFRFDRRNSSSMHGPLPCGRPTPHISTPSPNTCTPPSSFSPTRCSVFPLPCLVFSEEGQWLLCVKGRTTDRPSVPLNTPTHPAIPLMCKPQDKDRLRDWVADADAPTAARVDPPRFARWLTAVQQYISIRCVGVPCVGRCRGHDAIIHGRH